MKNEKLILEIYRTLELMNVSEKEIGIISELKNYENKKVIISEGVVGDAIEYLSKAFSEAKPITKKIAGGADVLDGFTIKNIQFTQDDYTWLRYALDEGTFTGLPSDVLKKIALLIKDDKKIVRDQFVDYIKQVNKIDNKFTEKTFIEEFTKKQRESPNKTATEILQNDPFNVDPLISDIISDEVTRLYKLNKDGKYVETFKILPQYTGKMLGKSWVYNAVTFVRKRTPDIIKMYRTRMKALVQKQLGSGKTFNSIQEDALENLTKIMTLVSEGKNYQKELFDQLFIISNMRNSADKELEPILEEYLYNPLKNSIGEENLNKFKNSEAFKKYTKGIEDSTYQTFWGTIGEKMCARFESLPLLSIIAYFMCKGHYANLNPLKENSSGWQTFRKTLQIVSPNFKRGLATLVWDDPRFVSEVINQSVKGGRTGNILGTIVSWTIGTQILQPLLLAIPQTAFQNITEIQNYNKQIKLLKELCEEGVLKSEKCKELKTLEAKTKNDFYQNFKENIPIYAFITGVNKNTEAGNHIWNMFTNLDLAVNLASKLLSGLMFDPNPVEEQIKDFQNQVQKILEKNNKELLSDLIKAGYKGNTNEEFETWARDEIEKAKNQPKQNDTLSSSTSNNIITNLTNKFLTWTEDLTLNATKSKPGFIYFLSKYDPPRTISNPLDPETEGSDFDEEEFTGYDTEKRFYAWDDTEKRWFEYNDNNEPIKN